MPALFAPTLHDGAPVPLAQLGVGRDGVAVLARKGEQLIKILRPEIAADEELLRRFRKEGRVLAKVGSPYIANFIDLNEDRGLHYLVLELVAGGSVAAAVRRLGKLPERLALSIIADTCRALAEPHRLGIVHRDIKPDNMMFVRPGLELEADATGQLIKLGDFGIARLVEQAQPGEGATREGAVLGTPEFMSPEQCQGTGVTPATDVYALGCCLFALIAGRPPFVTHDDNQMAVILQQLREPPPRLDAVADLVARCLQKDPRARPQDATEVLAAIEKLTTGSAALITAHPAAPVVYAQSVQTYAFEWELQSSPDALWPFVSNTEKMNRATGLAPVRFEIESVGARTPESPATTGMQRVAGLQLKWREHPYEWIEGSRHVVLRVFEKGVLRWYVAEVTLERTAGGGTKLRNTIRLEPRGFLAKILSKWEIGVKCRRKLDAVYTRLDRVLAAGPRPEIDPITPEVVVPAAARAAVQRAQEALLAQGVDHRRHRDGEARRDLRHAEGRHRRSARAAQHELLGRARRAAVAAARSRDDHAARGAGRRQAGDDADQARRPPRRARARGLVQDHDQQARREADQARVRHRREGRGLRLADG
jgi:serine/threonine protein kinase